MICEWFSKITMVYEHLSAVIIICWTGIMLGMPRSAPASLGFAWLINRLIYGCYRYGCEEFEMFIYTVLLFHIIWPDDYLTYDAHMILTYYHLTPNSWHLISDTGTSHGITWHLIPDTWYLTPALDILYLTPDLWHLISDTGTEMLHLTPDTWHLISDTGTWYLILDTWSLILDIWHRHWYVTLDTWSLTPALDMLYLIPDLWHLISDTGTDMLHLIPDTWYLIPVLDVLSLDT